MSIVIDCDWMLSQEAVKYAKLERERDELRELLCEIVSDDVTDKAAYKRARELCGIDTE